eukprot:GHVL01004437.1.p1 GENE.GHVL01004437.1~~GHVL01004437.1.p1  ORF type:complete len:164 (+),score=18.56 GHVL01004437.1:22-513(+)
MRIEKCWFCSSSIYPGHGVAFVRNDCKVFRFCRPKCHKHFKAKHNPRKCKWTKAYRKSAGKEMAMDTSFEFEKHRNTPVRYNRNLYIKTIRAMQIVDRIKEARKSRYYRRRLALQQTKHQNLAKRTILKNQTLLEGPQLVRSSVKISKQKAAEEANPELMNID